MLAGFLSNFGLSSPTKLSDQVQRREETARELKPFYAPNSGPCETYNITERCTGSEGWCSEQSYYKQDGYKSQDECFNDRKGQIPWAYMNVDCSLKVLSCDGSDGMCFRIENEDRRHTCFLRYLKGYFLEPHTPGCVSGPVGVEKDERCSGTKAYCGAARQVKAYGSEQACLRRRQTAPAGERKKTPFLPAQRVCASDAASEVCIGTEATCRGDAKCLDRRQQPPFLHPWSASCDHHSPEDSEACAGTAQYCSDETRIKWYGSRKDCINSRGAPEPVRWLQPSEAKGCTNGTEICEGTEAVCWPVPSKRDECFRARGLAPFLLPNSKAKAGTEAALGTDEWCHKGFHDHGYDSENECFQRRGHDQDALHAKLAKEYKGKFKEILYKIMPNITTEAAKRELIAKKGTAEDFKRESTHALKMFLDGLPKRAADEAIFSKWFTVSKPKM
ncbi:hypothetical protein MANI_118717 [Metarhizium anisopliae]|nr:hypothetical protein MANI_118717 [Metarhizium anisopliae]